MPFNSSVNAWSNFPVTPSGPWESLFLFLIWKCIRIVKGYLKYSFHIMWTVIAFAFWSIWSMSMLSSFSLWLFIVFPYYTFDSCRVCSDVLCFISDSGNVSFFLFSFSVSQKRLYVQNGVGWAGLGVVQNHSLNSWHSNVI